MFVPRTADEITEAIVAKVVARTGLTDTVEGSTLHLISRCVAEEIEASEFRLAQIRNSFDVNNPQMSDSDFDERLKELPGSGFRRLGAVAAAGPVLTVYRKDTTQQATLPAGSTFGRGDGSTLLYRTTADVVFNIGTASVTGIFVVCTTPGKAGNCAVGVMNKGVTTPSWVIGSVNEGALGNGADQETVESARQRAVLYLSALGGSQKAAMEYLAKSFTASDGTRAKFAKVFVNPAKPGYAELVVDDGSGFPNSTTQVAASLSGTVPPGGQSVIVHPSPLTGPVNTLVTTPSGGAALFLLDGMHYDSVYEQGYIRLRAAYWMGAAATWAITNPLVVYGGFLGELQRFVNGDVNDPHALPGWSAVGCRVVVKPPTVVNVSFAVHVVPRTGVNYEDVKVQTWNVFVEHTGNLGPGDPLYVSALVAACMTNPDVLNVRVYEAVAADGTPNVLKQDVYPAEKQVLRTTKDLVTFFTSVN